MRLRDFIAALAVLAICGCAGQRVSYPSQPTPACVVSAEEFLAGTWQCGERGILLELGSNERWKWWDLHEQSGHTSDPPMLAGSWFVHKGLLYLRIEHTKEEPERIGPGLAFTF